MKKQVTATLIFMFAFLLTNAQTDNEYANLVQSSVKIDVKEYVYRTINLTDAEMQKFDPLFNRYLKHAGKNEVKKITIFDQYFNDGSAMTDIELNKLNIELLKTDKERSRINKEFYKKFKKVLGVNKATTFFFLKKSIDNMVEGSRLEALNN